DLLQARARDRRGPSPPPPVGVLPLLRHLGRPAGASSAWRGLDPSFTQRPLHSLDREPAVAAHGANALQLPAACPPADSVGSDLEDCRHLAGSQQARLVPIGVSRGCLPQLHVRSPQASAPCTYAFFLAPPEGSC